MKKIYIAIIVIVAIFLVWLGVVYIGLGNDASHVNTNDISSEIEKTGSDPKNITYRIDDESVALSSGLSEKQATPGSASKL